MWEGQNIGEIKELVASTEISPETAKLYWKDGQAVYLTRMVGTIQLIVDELKPLFGLEKIGRMAGLWEGQKVCIHRSLGAETLFEGEIINDDVRRAYFFRWVLGLPTNKDSSLFVRQTGERTSITSVYELSLSRKPQLASSLVKKYYGSPEAFNAFGRSLVSGRSLNEWRELLSKIIQRVDKSRSLLVSYFVKRLSPYIDSSENI